MSAAGLLLTGGRSRRMGRDKAALVLPGSAVGLAERTGRLLRSAVSGPCLEVGPGRSGLPTAPEEPPGEGPLAALAAGARALRSAGWDGPAVVVATDLPRLTVGLLTWLVGRPGSRSVVPVDGGRPQPLCARYGPDDLDTAIGLVAAGRRAMGDLLAVIDPLRVRPEEWWAPAGRGDALDDVDTPEDLARVTPGPDAPDGAPMSTPEGSR